jgi:hypothetical protein
MTFFVPEKTNKAGELLRALYGQLKTLLQEDLYAFFKAICVYFAIIQSWKN